LLDTFDRSKAIARYTQRMQLIHAGTDREGDETDQEAQAIAYEAAQHGLEFHSHKESDTYTLEPLSAENKAAFLHVNVENLLSLLRETAHYLLSLPYESKVDKSYRLELHERISEAIHQSYRVPVMLEVNEEELGVVGEEESEASHE
jgi:hypothetical protein